MAQELEVGTLGNAKEVVLNQCKQACGPRTCAKSCVEPAPLWSALRKYFERLAAVLSWRDTDHEKADTFERPGEDFFDVGYIRDHALFG